MLLPMVQGVLEQEAGASLWRPQVTFASPSHWDFFWLAAKVLGEEMPLWDRNRN